MASLAYFRRFGGSRDCTDRAGVGFQVLSSLLLFSLPAIVGLEPALCRLIYIFLFVFLQRSEIVGHATYVRGTSILWREVGRRKVAQRRPRREQLLQLVWELIRHVARLPRAVQVRSLKSRGREVGPERIRKCKEANVK